MTSNYPEPEELQLEIERLRSIDPVIGLTDMELIRRARPLAESFKGQLPRADELAHLTKELGSPIAGEVYFQSLIRSPKQAEFLQKVKSKDLTPAPFVESGLPEIVVLHSQPISLRRRWGDHVGQWRTWARQVGYPTDEIETKKESSLIRNVDLIEEYFSRRSGKPCLVVTYGQGSAEFRFWYQKRVQAQTSARFALIDGILGWIDICGNSHGSTWAQSLSEKTLRGWYERLKFRLQGQNVLAQQEQEPRLRWWKGSFVTDRIWRVAIVGLTNRSQMPARLVPVYEHLSHFNPNDGRATLSDSVGPDGNIPNLGIIMIKGMTAEAENSSLYNTFQRVLRLAREENLKEILSGN